MTALELFYFRISIARFVEMEQAHDNISQKS